MNLISPILLPENVLLDAESTSKKRVLERAGILFENSRQVARSQIFDSLFAREKLGSTGLGHGVAIPHGRIKGLRDAMAAFIKTQAPIPFDAPDGQPVNLIFVLLVPERATDIHKAVDPAPDPKYLRLVGLTMEEALGKVHKPVGCDNCNGLGYRGRKGVYEMMIMNSRIRDLAFNVAPVTEIRRAAVDSGMRTLTGDGRIKILNGTTTADEVARMTQSDLDNE